MTVLDDSYLNDSFGRSFHYLRLSVTEACNFRCVYCLPDGYRRTTGSEPLSIREIGNLVSAFASLGLWKVRLTGGEPMLRRDILEIASRVASTPGIRRLGLTTNGYRLKQLAGSLKEAGVTSINVSVDSLDRERFRDITGRDGLDEVLAGIDAAFSAGFDKVKVNVVLLKGKNDHDIDSFIDWARRAPVDVRFIELMRTGWNGSLFEASHMSAGQIRLRLLKEGWSLKTKNADDGPSVDFERADYQGSVGLIAPYSKDFCRSCNRLRVSSVGGLRLCLFGEKDFSLRPLTEDDTRRDELAQAIREHIWRKPEYHLLHEGKYGNTSSLSAIGG